MNTSPLGSAKRRKRGSLWVIPLAMAMASAPAFADHSPALDRVSIWVGGYYTNNNTKLGANTNVGQAYLGQSNGSVNFEKDLNFKKHKTVPRARLDFLIGDSQGFSFDYYSIDRSHSRSLSDSVSIGGNTYDAAVQAKGKLNFDFGSAAYRWWFGHGNSVFGLGLGAAYYKVNAGIRGTASVTDLLQTQSSTRYRESAWAPELQLGWRYAFNDQWRIYIDASGVKKNGGDLNGHIYNADAGVEWFPWHNVGFGADYSYNRIHLHDRRSDYRANLDMKVNGPSLFVRFRF